jgi:hypothetical protein
MVVERMNGNFSSEPESSRESFSFADITMIVAQPLDLGSQGGCIQRLRELLQLLHSAAPSARLRLGVCLAAFEACSFVSARLLVATCFLRIVPVVIFCEWWWLEAGSCKCFLQ